ncbi:hypothetical protein QQ008_10060 [Fulvivirgaceae bacterium BMA10]|uniref:ATP-binding protein n=1 Tax=Splendidivirga corallicola TaxID=3051826 RepID=A0ABT8KLV6_9BACT|nr:hypothetical protein [Fulvivirgaceae bacterium BMA10]
MVSLDSLGKILENRHSTTFFKDLARVMYKLDYHEIYNSPDLKAPLMELLDEKLYRERSLNQVRNSYGNDQKYINRKIKMKVGKDIFPSIQSNQALYSVYKDSILNELLENYDQENETYWPYQEAITLHSYIAWPESYTAIKNWWQKTGKDQKSIFYLPLVKMRSPEALALYDHKVARIVETNGENQFLNLLYSELSGEINNSYSILKLQELLTVNKSFMALSEGGSELPFNCEVARYLVSIANRDLTEKIVLKSSTGCEKLVNSKNELARVVSLLIAFYEEKESYWYKQMPY